MALAGTTTVTVKVPEAAQELANELRQHADGEYQMALQEAEVANALAETERQLKNLEAIMVLTGLEGKNAQEREANLRLILENNHDHQRLYGELREQLVARARIQAMATFHLRQFMLKLELVRSMRVVT